jgi:hypothetical protein
MHHRFGRDNNYCHYIIQRIAGLAITLNGRKTSLLVVVFELLLVACLLFLLIWLPVAKRLFIVVGEEHLLLASVPPAQHYIPTSHSAMHNTLMSMLLHLVVMRLSF